LIWSNHGLSCINIEVWCPIKDLIEKIWNQRPNRKRCVQRRTEINRIRGQIEEDGSLLINWGSICINLIPWTKVKMAADILIWQGYNWIESKLQLRTWLNKSNMEDWFGNWCILMSFPFKWNDAFWQKWRHFIHCSQKKSTTRCRFKWYCASSSSPGCAAGEKEFIFLFFPVFSLSLSLPPTWPNVDKTYPSTHPAITLKKGEGSHAL